MKAGTRTEINLHRTNVKRAYTPKSDCKDISQYKFDKTYYNAIVGANFTYTQSQCTDLCLQAFIVSACACFDLQFDAIVVASSLQACLNQSQIRCANRAYAAYTDGSDISDALKDKCDSMCPLECESNELSTEVSTSSFPTEDYANIIKNFAVLRNAFASPNDINQEVLAQNTLAFNVFFNDLEYTQIEESPVNDLVDLVANVGGTVGVFIGISILSLAEVIEFFIEAGIIICKAKIAPKKKKKNAYKV